MSKTFAQYDLLDGEAHIYRHERSGDVWQFRMWIKNEQKDYRKSLKTRDFNSAMSSAKVIARELSANGLNGTLNFGITVQELLDLYLEYREKDIDLMTGITRRRWQTLKCQLKYFLLIMGAHTNVSALDKECLYEYVQMRKDIKHAELETLRNEKSTINNMMKFAYRNNYSHFEHFEFKPIKIKHEGKRDTFKDKEYEKLYKFMRKYVSEKECPDDMQRLERLMIQDYVLISANTGLRVGEIKQLTWNDVLGYEEHITNEKTEETQLLVELQIRWQTSKVRKDRTFFARGGEYFQRLKERQQFTEPHHLVFSMNGTKTLHHKMWAKHWNNLMQGIGINNHRERNLTWYSLRHWCITQRVISGCDLIDISKMAGTSVKHIENTYLKYRKEQSRTSALKSYKKGDNGTIITI